MRQRTRPKKLRNLGQEVVRNTVPHCIASLEHGVDTIGEDIRALPARRHKAPVHLCASAISNKNHTIDDLTIDD